MSVDQGGLRYSIEVTDQFSKNTEKFRDEITRSRVAITQFQKSLNDFSTASSKIRTTQQELAVAQATFNKRLKESTPAASAYGKALDLASRAHVRLAGAEKNSLSQQKALSAARNKNAANLRSQASSADKLAAASKSLAKTTSKTAAASRSQVAAYKKVIIGSRKARDVFIREAAAIRKLTSQRNKDIKAATRQAAALAKIKSSLVAPKVPGSKTTPTAPSPKRVPAPGIPPPDTLRRVRKEFENIYRSSNRATTGISGFQRVFIRLISAFVFFAAARAVVNAFKQMVSSSISFNSVIEQSVLGISSLIVAVGEVRDATGEATTSAEQLGLAQIEARKQVALLRREGLKTAATFQQLTTTFQTAIAPGIQAGLNLDEIRKFTVQISQAAAAIGLPQEQLAEEVRSLLQGTITPRQTRIATALGITNEDIARFKELGTLSQELETRFQAFSIAGEQALDTFQARLTNASDALQQLFAEGGVDFFREVKGLLGDIQNSIVQITDEGVIINPDAVTVAREFFNGLRDAVSEARQLGKELDLKDFAKTARVAGTVIGTAAKVVAAIVKGFVSGLSSVVRVFELAKQKVQEIRSEASDILNTDSILEGITRITEFAVAFSAVLATAKLLSLLLSTIVIPFKVIASLVGIIGSGLSLVTGAVSLIGLLFSPIGVTVGLIAAGVYAIGLLVNDWLKDITGVDLKFGSIVKIVKVVLVGAFKVLASVAKAAFKGAIYVFEVGFRGAVVAALYLIKKLAEGTAYVVGIFSDSAAEKIEEFEKRTGKVLDEQRAKLDQADKENRKALGEATDGIAQVARDAGEEMGQGILEAFENNDSADTFSDLLKKGIQTAKDGLGNALTDLGVPSFDIAAQSVESARSLSEEIANIPPAISKAESGLKNLASLLTKLDEEALKAREDLETGLLAIGSAGAASDQAKDLLDSQRRIRKETKAIEVELLAARTKQVGIASKQLKISDKIKSIDESTQKTVSDGILLGQKAAEKRRQIAKETQEASVATIKIKQAQASYDDDEVQKQTKILDLANKRRKGLEQELETLNSKIDLSVEGLDTDSRALVTSLITESISLLGQQKLTEEDIANILKGRLKVETLINETVAERLKLTAAQETNRLRAIIVERQNELSIAKDLFSVRGSLNELDASAANARSDLKVQELRLSLIKEEQAATLDLLEKNIINTKDQEAKNALLSQKQILLEANTAELALELEILNQQKRVAEAINAVSEEPVRFGFLQAILDFTRDSLSSFRNTVEVMTTLLEGAGDIWNDIVAASLDPTKKVDILQKFRDLMTQIVQIITTAFLKARIFELLTSVFGFSAGDIKSLGLATGLHEGGLVPKKARPSPAHLAARGYNKGGPIHPARPKGLHPKDTIPIWAQKDEHIQPVKRVRQYGLDLFERIRKGLADPAALRAAAGLGPRKRFASSSGGGGPGFNLGGSVSQQVQQSSDARSLKIVNVVSKDMIYKELTTPQGQELILNIIRSNGGV